MRHVAICRSSGWYRPCAAVLEQRVLAGHAEVGAAVLHVGRHVGGAHQHHAHVGRGWWRGSACAIFSGSSSTSMPAALSSGSDLVEDAALGQREGDHAALDAARCRRRGRAAWLPCGRSRGRGGRCGRPAVSPSATRPAITRLAEARRSVAITVAPDSCVDALHHRGVAVDLDLRAQAHQLVDVHEAVLEDRLGDRARCPRRCSSAP